MMFSRGWQVGCESDDILPVGQRTCHNHADTAASPAAQTATKANIIVVKCLYIKQLFTYF